MFVFKGLRLHFAMHGECSVLSFLHGVHSKLCSGGLLEAPLQCQGVEKVQYKALLILHKLCCECQTGQRLG